jgi:RNA polymerase sigma factor (TIGR02999 family)
VPEGAVLDDLCGVLHGEDSDALVPLVYEELRRLARSIRSATSRGTGLQTTEIVHEAWLKLSRDGEPRWNSRAHFFGAAARAMRELLVDQARRRGRLKRGGDLRRVGAEEIALPDQRPFESIVAVHEALERLEEDDPRKGEIVNLRFFAGLTTEETAAVLGVSSRTVEREWRYVRAWLYDRLTI